MFGLPSWLLFIPVVAFLIFIHEFGHFATAKLFGIKVLEFGFGFPPRIFGVSYRGTIYSVNWLLPLGGFVRFVGEEDPNDPDSLVAHSVGKRAIVLTAGSLMNLALPVVVFTILFMLPHDTLVGGDVLVRGVAPGSPAKMAGLRGGDTILSVDGQRVALPGELVDLIADNVGQPVELIVRRGALVSGLGLSPEYSVVDPVTVVPRSNPREMRIVEEVSDPETEASLADARRYDASLKVGDTLAQSYIGVIIGLANPRFEQTRDPVWRAVPNSFITIWDILSLTKSAFVEGVANRSNPGVAGPIGIAQATGEGVDRFGVAWLWQITVLISLSLGILNLLPIPALDGGRLVFVGLEWIRRGKRISPRREGLVHLVGFVALIGFVVFMSYFDLVRLLSGESLIR